VDQGHREQVAGAEDAHPLAPDHGADDLPGSAEQLFLDLPRNEVPTGRQPAEQRQQVPAEPFGDLDPQGLEGGQEQGHRDQRQPHVAQQLADQHAGHAWAPW
jgi:hypothetical protein